MIQITDKYGNIVADPKEAMLRANEINPNSDVSHSYESYKRVTSSIEEDKNALDASINVAESIIYGVAGPGKSCIDVAQAAFESLVNDRDLDTPWYLPGENIPGESDLIPKNWFDKLEERVDSAHNNNREQTNKIEVITEPPYIDKYSGEGLEPK